MKNRKVLETIILVCVSLLFFIFPIEGTTGIRNVLLILSLILALYLFKNNLKSVFEHKIFKMALLLLGAFTLWIPLQAIFFSEYTLYSLNEFRDQWLLAVAGFIIGICSIDLKEKNSVLKPENIITAVFMAMFLHVLYTDLYALYLKLQGKELPLGIGGLTRARDENSFMINTFALLLFAEMFQRAVHKRRLVKIGDGGLALIFVSTLSAIYLTGTRLGVITFIFVGVTFAVLFIKHLKNKKLALSISLLIVSISMFLGYLNIQKDSRWQTLIETLPIAFDTKNHKYWLDRKKYPRPILPNGTPINDSNYLRPAQMKVAAELLMEYPLGVGFGRRAYKHALVKKYNEGHGHPHSGLLNLADGVGIPGIILWVAFVLTLVIFSWKTYNKNPNFFALALFLVSIGFNSRSLVDMSFQNHNLVMFLLLIGILSIGSIKYAKNIFR